VVVAQIQEVTMVPEGGPAIGSHEIRDAEPDTEKADKATLDTYKKYVRIGVSALDKRMKWVKRGDALFKGEKNRVMNEEYKDSSNETATPTRVNKLRRKVVGAVNQIYSRNPKFVGTPRRPILVPADPVPMMVDQPDPVTGAIVQVPQVDPMTGKPMMTTPIDPATGEPQMQDISEQVAEVVAAIMDHIFMESGFKGEAKQCVLESHNRPGSWMQTGYQFDEANKIDDVYFRWRSFKRIILDPEAEVYNGAIRQCRFIGVRWSLREDQAKRLGLSWLAMAGGSEDADRKQDDESDDQKRDVYQVWCQDRNEIAWISQGAKEFARNPEPWPWEIDGYPFAVLKMTEDPDEQFSKPLIMEAECIQDEMDEQRETMLNDITCNRKLVLYDTKVLAENDVNQIIGRKQKGWKGVDGLTQKEPFRVVNDAPLDAEFFQHYERNEAEMDQVLGTSANEQLTMTGKTAREVEEVSKSQGTMTGAKSDILADFMNSIVRKAVQIMRQTYKEERVTQITTRDGSRFWVKWKGSEILSEVDLKVEVGSTMAEDDDTRKQVALNLFDKLQTVAGISVKRLTNDLLREHGKKNPEQYWDQAGPVAGNIAGAGPASLPAPVPGGNQSPVDVRASLAGQMSPAVQGG
jgi:hypothetical protein